MTNISGEKDKFIKCPRALFSDKKFDDLSIESKILFAVLLDRKELSKKYNMIDNNNQPYIIFSISSIQNLFNCCKNKAIKLLSELQLFGLIHKESRRAGLADLIFVSDEFGDKYSFVKLPRGLFFNTAFETVPVEAKLLYAFMLDRKKLSEKNKILGQGNRPYIIWPTTSVMTLLGCCKQKASRLVSVLKEFGLIEKERSGFNKPDRIYIMDYANFIHSDDSENDLALPDTQPLRSKKDHCKSDNHSCGSSKNIHVEVENSYHNKTLYSKTDVSNTNLSINNTELHDLSVPPKTASSIQKRYNELKNRSSWTIKDYIANDVTANLSYKNLKEFAKNQINYCDLVNFVAKSEPSYEMATSRIDEIIDIMIDIYSLDSNQRIKIAGSFRSADVVKNKFLNLNYEKLCSIFYKIDTNRESISNPFGYLKAMLYNAASCMSYNTIKLQHPELNTCLNQTC